MTKSPTKQAPQGYHYMPSGELMKNQDMTNDTQESNGLSQFIPLIFVFGYILMGTIILSTRFQPISSNLGYSTIMDWMANFMGFWFLIFSLFKMINIPGFAKGYSTYDIIAKRFLGWGYVFPFVELILGIAYVTRFNLVATNIATFVILSITSIGVIQSKLQGHKIQCACLGTVLKVPITNITLVEDLLMVAMALIMLVM